MSKPPQPVLLYDGDCGLCNALMRYMLKRDRRGVLLFASLQGPTAQAFLKRHGLDTGDFDSLVFVTDLFGPDEAFHLRTEGALRAFGEIGGIHARWARVLGRVPRSWRDLLYKGVARLRYRLFGRYRPTPLPDPRWAPRILD